MSGSSEMVDEAISKGIIEMVGINQVNFMRFARPANKPSTLGVHGLSACTVVVIVSKHAAIVAHIGPNIPNAPLSDPRSFIRLAEEKMDFIARQFYLYRSCFPAETKTYALYATMGGRVLTQEQKAVIQQRFGQMGVSARELHYETRGTGSPTMAPVNNKQKGSTVFVDGRSGPPKVYVDDREVLTVSQPARQAVASSSSAAGSSSAPTGGRWCKYPGRQDYHFMEGGRVLDQRSSAPIDQWISFLGPQGQHVKWYRWNSQTQAWVSG